MRLKKLAILVTLAGLLALGCSSKSNGPTGNNGFTLIMVMALQNTAGQPTIVAAQLLFDGITATVGTPSTASGPYVPLQTTLVGVASGNHTVTIQISTQTSSPNGYEVVTSSTAAPGAAPTINVFDQNNALLKSITLPIQMANLATGQGITYNFSL
jgi:hypothetical protein